MQHSLLTVLACPTTCPARPTQCTQPARNTSALPTATQCMLYCLPFISACVLLVQMNHVLHAKALDGFHPTATNCGVSHQVCLGAAACWGCEAWLLCMPC